ncbi:MAG: hypothetical protein ACR2OG_15920 [Gemmatimonadaceae bacterium]
MPDDTGPEGVLTLICLTCGAEKFFDQTPPPAITCDRCSGTTFRSYFTPTEADEATISQLEQVARSIALDGESPDISADDVRELNDL